MIFLGQAAGYNAGKIIRHVCVWGRKSDTLVLRSHLANRYGDGNLESVAIYRSGRSALAAALMAAGPKGTKVIIPGLTCIAVIRAIKAAGMEPVFCDITEKDLSYNLKHLDKLCKTCYNGIIMVQNTLGLAWDISKIEKIAEKRHCVIVEDLAHSAGRFYPDGRECGTVGVATALSFGKGKAVDTTNGGAVVIRRNLTGYRLGQPGKKPRLADRARDRFYPLFGGVSRALWPLGLGQPLLGGLVRFRWIERSADAELNLDVRLTNWQARLALHQLLYLRDNPPGRPLREFRLVKSRPKLLTALERERYNFSETWYDTPIAPARCGREVDFPAADCPETCRIAEQIINIPAWVPEKRLARAYEIIAKYEIRREDAKQK